MAEMKDIIEKLVGSFDDKKEYRQMMARVKSLPEDYQFVFEKIQKYMWIFGAGYGADLYGLIDLFESGAAEGKRVLDITGENVSAFCDELIRASSGYTEARKEKINREINEHFNKEG